VSPNEVHDLLHTPFHTDENSQNLEKIRKEIPEGAIALWIMKPTESNIKEARWGTYTRSTLIALLILYVIIYENFNSDIFAWFAMGMIGYEFAYTTLRKEKNEIDNLLAAEWYRKKVNKFLRKTYPEYKLPKEY
jgi:hypothetical protein